MYTRMLPIMVAMIMASSTNAQLTRTGKGESHWNNTWEWTSRLDHQFNAQGQEVMYTHHRVSVMDSSLSLSSITHKGYSGTGRMVWRSSRSVDPLTELLSIGDSTVLEYDAQDSLSVETTYALDGSSWVPGSRSTYHRNAIGGVDSILVDTNAAGTWELAARMLVTLTTEGWIEHIQYDSLLNNTWIPYAELAIAYDPDGHPVMMELTDPTPSPYAGTLQVYTYDAQGHTDSLVLSAKLPGGAWHAYSSAGYEPAGDGLSNLRSYYKLDTLSVDWTPNARLTYEPSTAMPERPAALLLRAFPNPATDQVFLPDLRAGVAVDLIAADGRVITGRRTGANGSLDIGDLAPGMYVARTPTTTGTIASTSIIKR